MIKNLLIKRNLFNFLKKDNLDKIIKENFNE